MSTGIRHMIVASFFFSVMTVFVKVVGQTIPLGQIVLVRSVLAVAFTSAMMWREGEPFDMGTRRDLLILRGLLGFGAICCFYFALPRLPLAEATIMQYSNPVFVALFAGFILRERVGMRAVAAIVLCMLGVLLLSRPTVLGGSASHSLDPVHVAVAMTGAFLSGVAYAIVRKLRETDTALTVVLYFPLLSIPLSMPLVFANHVWPSAFEWACLLAIGVTSQIGQVFMTRSFHAERAATASAASYIQILFAILWGLLFFGERLDAWLVTGAVLVVGGTAFVSLIKPRLQTTAPSVQPPPHNPSTR